MEGLKKKPLFGVDAEVGGADCTAPTSMLTS